MTQTVKTVEAFKSNTSYFSVDTLEFKSKGFQKSIGMPSFIVDIQNQNELNHFCQWVETRENYNVGFVQAPILSAKAVLSKKRDGLRQEKLDGSQQEPGFAAIMRQKALLINPQIELTYKTVPGLKNLDFTGLPKTFTETIKALNKKSTPLQPVDKKGLFLGYIESLKNPREMTTHVANFSDRQLALGADIIQTATPVIRDEYHDSLEVGEKINDLTKNLYPEDVILYTYNLHISAFKTAKMSDEILKSINKNKYPIIGIRILDAYNFDRKEYHFHLANLKEFIEGLNHYKENFGLHTLFFDLDALGFFLITKGMDGFSTAINGEIPKAFRAGTGRTIRKPNWQMGKYFLYDKLINVDFGTLNEIKQNNKGLPCFCEDCKSRQDLTLRDASREEKTIWSRRHYLNIVQEKFSEFKAAIHDKSITKSFNTLENSACRQYTSVLI